MADKLARSQDIDGELFDYIIIGEYPRSGLGGSSAMNVLAYTEPVHEEMDMLEALGNPGWNWETFQKYAKKAEGFRTPCPREIDGGFRDLYNSDSVGHSGPLTLSFAPTGTGADAAFQQSLAKNGLSVLADAAPGRFYQPLTQIRAVVWMLQRPNLKVLTEAYVCRILTEGRGENVVARGVEFKHGGRMQKVFAAREIILILKLRDVLSRAIKSPQILELSGIGDKEILEPLGINAVIDLPAVGGNLQEHYVCRSPYMRMKEGKGLISGHMLTDERAAVDVKEMHKLSIDYTVVMNAFAFTPLQTVTDRVPQIIAKKKAQLTSNWATYSPGLRKQFELMLKLLESDKGADIEYLISATAFRPVPEPHKPHMGITSNLTHPWSRGAIRTPPFSDLIDLELTPGSAVDVTTDEKLKEFIGRNIATTWHTCGTCSMMPKDLGGVVDPELRVYGTKNMRVVDLSVLPLMVAVHTQAIVYGIAEQGEHFMTISSRTRRADAIMAF
ncbi:uncharacterized protein PHACADRAFT_135864 [Phanerochaete carnosa HHB-10118-sp]|uniref:Glucose-methanol-choline oxidoreductase N-terminal domain-containing protein n=1 Tax=Phanerochaete carnosa (strain HHB-10118-sp) TaxID=650164 RepID=K5V7K9_PHACS|nr:uncharacterized protein PHACADRAFT_135864 [Phanerochaete carnosa HHB-10118-sp]EKM58756.1 hypothetical protein PHACADRAFT_135864 [Phanerochaete carnosa HHB-10118-sp]